MLSLLLSVWLLAVITPGPDFVVIVRYATSGSRRHGVMAAIGSNCGILLWATATMLGFSALMARWSWLYEIVRLAGAGYLVLLGVRMLWSSRRADYRDPRDALAPLVNEPGQPKQASLWRAWRKGFLTNAANPKAVVFFGSLLGALLPPHPSAGLRVMVVAAIVGTSLAWYTIVAGMFGSGCAVRLYRRIRRWVDRVIAAMFIGLGTRLALER